MCRIVRRIISLPFLGLALFLCAAPANAQAKEKPPKQITQKDIRKAVKRADKVNRQKSVQQANKDIIKSQKKSIQDADKKTIKNNKAIKQANEKAKREAQKLASKAARKKN